MEKTVKQNVESRFQPLTCKQGSVTALPGGTVKERDTRPEGGVVHLPLRYFACRYCELQEICVNAARDSNRPSLTRIIEHPRPFHRGDYLFHQGDPVGYFYIINSGVTKQFITTREGAEQVVNFTLMGEAVSLDYLEGGRHNSNVMALDTTSVCAIPLSRLNREKDLKVTLAGYLLRFAAMELTRKYELQQLIGQGSAENKLAFFLNDMAARLEQTGHPRERVMLPMSRHDIANYLCLADETISRLFSKFSEWGVLKVDKKRIQITDFDTLSTMANNGRAGAPAA
jgi:CRP/FNR family transcriptional regulator